MSMQAAALVRTGLILCTAGSILLWAEASSPANSPPTTIAVVGATIIDGNGGDPVQDGVVVITGQQIAGIGKRGEVEIPKRAKTINAQGKFVVPGFVDTNVHLDMNSELFPLVVYGDYEDYFKHSLAMEGAQIALKHGVTTILDTYGALLPLMKLRDRINSGEVVGPRLLVAGNIIGWDGPLSPSESKRKPADLKQWEKDYNAWFTQGTGAALTQMYPDEVRDAINKYIDLGPDFIKVGATIHDISSPIPLGFSPQVLRTIVETAHARGLKVQVHSGTIEGHRVSVEAGVDVITHAGSLYAQKLRPDYAKALCDSNTYFAIFAHSSLPPYAYLRNQTGAAAGTGGGLSDEKIRIIESITPDRDRTPRLAKPLESKLPGADNPLVAFRRENDQALVDAGCKVAVATDSHPSMYDDIAGYSRMHPDIGFGTINAIEGLVTQMGMTPAKALVAGTKTSATAAGLVDKIGTLEQGKMADLLVLDANPLEDIHNIRKVSRIVHNGAVIDPASLPVKPKFYKR